MGKTRHTVDDLCTVTPDDQWASGGAVECWASGGLVQLEVYLGTETDPDAGAGERGERVATVHLTFDEARDLAENLLRSLAEAMDVPEPAKVRCPPYNAAGTAGWPGIWRAIAAIGGV